MVVLIGRLLVCVQVCGGVAAVAAARRVAQIEHVRDHGLLRRRSERLLTDEALWLRDAPLH